MQVQFNPSKHMLDNTCSLFPVLVEEPRQTVRLVVHKPTYLPIDRVDSLLKFQTPNKHYNISKLIIGNSRAIYQLLICNGPNIHDACR